MDVYHSSHNIHLYMMYVQFTIQYLPHEMIKKATWFIYHPKVIKFRLQVIHLFEKSFGKKEAVKPKDGEEGRRGTVERGVKRFTGVVNTMLDDVADDIIGRQVSTFVVRLYTHCYIIHFIQYVYLSFHFSCFIVILFI